MPLPSDDVVILDPDTGVERARARFDPSGRLQNAGEAIGEIVNRSGGRGFEGYYKDPVSDTERVHDGGYWSGDLGYRDEQGYFYFAGRLGDRLRVDSENFAAAPVERILERHPDVAACAVYAVPDATSGDQVMAALELRAGARFDPPGFSAFVAAQPDLGTKWAPRFVRIFEGAASHGDGEDHQTLAAARRLGVRRSRVLEPGARRRVLPGADRRRPAGPARRAHPPRARRPARPRSGARRLRPERPERSGRPGRTRAALDAGTPTCSDRGRTETRKAHR